MSTEAERSVMQRTSPIRGFELVIHHGREITDELIKEVIRECGKGRSHSSKPKRTDEETFQHWKIITLKHPLASALFFEFVVPSRPGTVELRHTDVGYFPRAPHRGEFNHRKFEIPLFEQESGWSTVRISGTSVDFTDSFDSQWCLTKFAPPLAVFEPDFAFGDTDVNVVKHIGNNPRARVWPILAYGPEKVKEIGRERLLEAPVFRVDELDYGGMWLQVTENPFVAKRADLRKLAEYLSLEMPD
jgi:hypothetical protein